MGFDGLVVSDWNGIGQVAGCTNASCAQAINAGMDIVMVPNDWKAFIANTIAQVESGEIADVPHRRRGHPHPARRSTARGIFDGRRPSDRVLAGDASRLDAEKLAREAVRKSQVLLKNNGNVLPLARNSKVLVVGKSADSLPNQTGGWSLTWQGTGNTNADFPERHLDPRPGLREALGTANVTFSETADECRPVAVRRRHRRHRRDALCRGRRRPDPPHPGGGQALPR